MHVCTYVCFSMLACDKQRPSQSAIERPHDLHVARALTGYDGFHEHNSYRGPAEQVSTNLIKGRALLEPGIEKESEREGELIR